MTIFSNTHKSAIALASRGLLVGMLGAFASSAAALPDPVMAVNPVDPDNCVIYTTMQAGPFKKFGIVTPALTDTYAANVCSEGDILPGGGKFNAPKGDVPPYLVNNTVALAAAGIISLGKSTTVLETHTVDAASLLIASGAKAPSDPVPPPPPLPPHATGPHDGSRWYDVDLNGAGTSFTGVGIPFPIINSTGVDGDIVCKKNALTTPNLSGKVTEVPGGIEVLPGNYGIFNSKSCNIIYLPDPLNPDLDYTFLYFISRGTTTHDFSNKPVGQVLRILVEQFVSHGHPGGFNGADVPDITVWIAGVDGAYGGLNENPPGDVSGAPAVWTNGGDGRYNVCHVYAKNGTMSVKGHVGLKGRLLGKNVQKLGGQSATIEHPQQICDPGVKPQCIFINNLVCDDTTLTVQGEGLTEANISFLAAWDETATTTVQTLLAGPAASATSSVGSVGLTFAPSGTAFTAPLSVLGGFTDGTVRAYVGLIGPDTGPAVTSGFYTKTDQLLELVVSGGNIETCTVVTP